jgi:signal transduction histidine kinase
MSRTAHVPGEMDEDSSDALKSLCHDLRQYVAAGLLLARMPGDNEFNAEFRHRLDLIHQQFATMSQLIASESESLREKEWALDLVKLVDECVKVVQLTHRVTVQTVVAAESALTYGDPALLRRAVTNVLDNASRAAGRGGTVQVRIDGSDAETWLEVSDEGAGFGRITSGTGQGLQVVDSAVRASHGRLVISSGPGPGTTVRLALPSRSSLYDQP